MPIVSPERFASGMTWSEFLASCTKHVEERKKRYEAVTFTPEQQQVLDRLRNLNLKVLVLEEDWCGDAARSGPVLARIAEAAGMDARWFPRDQNLDIIDQYLENGTSRAIPVFLFMDRNGEFLSRWGSRPAAVRAAREPFLPMPAKDDPAYPERFQQMLQALFAAYDNNFPEAIVDELLQQVSGPLAAKQ